MKIGVIREGKVPQDSRVAFTPEQAKKVQELFGLKVVIQASDGRCFDNEEYADLGLDIVDHVDDCDVLIGIKEVPIDQLIPNKTYFFFSHTIKKQAYNRKLLLAILDKNIRLIDYEAITNEKGQRLVAFGVFAGMVGAHNALWTYGQRSGLLELPRMHTFDTYADAKTYYRDIDVPNVRIVLTGKGRVASGARDVLLDMGIREVSPEDFLSKEFDTAVFSQLGCREYAAHMDGRPFELQHFFDHPAEYKSIFDPYGKKADILINGIFYDKRSPAFFTLEEMRSAEFGIQVIADVTCDIAPASSIPSTMKASTIADPVFGFDAVSEQMIGPYQENGIDMMTIDNLPSELPKNASAHFGDALIKYILPELASANRQGPFVERATVTENQQLTPAFAYLQDYVDGVG